MQLIHLFEAIRLVRDTPPFTDRASLRDVRVAVIDTGFNPDEYDEFKNAAGQTFVNYFENAVGPFTGFVRHSPTVGSRTAPSGGHHRRPQRRQHTSYSGVLNSLVDVSEPIPD